MFIETKRTFGKMTNTLARAHVHTHPHIKMKFGIQSSAQL